MLIALSKLSKIIYVVLIVEHKSNKYICVVVSFYVMLLPCTLNFNTHKKKAKVEETEEIKQRVSLVPKSWFCRIASRGFSIFGEKVVSLVLDLTIFFG